MNGNSKKWRPWKGSSRKHKGSSLSGCKRPDSSSVNSDGLIAAMATVVRAPPKDFMAVRQEWATIRIQTAFRGFLVILKIFKLSHFLVIFYLFNVMHLDLVICKPYVLHVDCCVVVMKKKKKL